MMSDDNKRSVWNSPLKTKHPPSVPKSLVKAGLLLVYGVAVVKGLAVLAEVKAAEGLSPEYLGWFKFIGFNILAFLVAGFVGVLLISDVVNEATAFLGKRLHHKSTVEGTGKESQQRPEPY